uniref:Putative ovule protein n=1 Tax=Solanum chacoense TaxID=4108 RepID=A0A0V0GX88_SOLCH
MPRVRHLFQPGYLILARRYNCLLMARIITCFNMLPPCPITFLLLQICQIITEGTTLNKGLNFLMHSASHHILITYFNCINGPCISAAFAKLLCMLTT